MTGIEPAIFPSVMGLETFIPYKLHASLGRTPLRNQWFDTAMPGAIFYYYRTFLIRFRATNELLDSDAQPRLLYTIRLMAGQNIEHARCVARTALAALIVSRCQRCSFGCALVAHTSVTLYGSDCALDFRAPKSVKKPNGT